MKTNNLKDLTALTGYPKAILEPIKVGTWRPHHDNGIKIMTVPDAMVVNQLVTRRYRAAIKYNKGRIDEQFKALYGKPLYFSEKLTSTLILRIKEIMAATGKSLKEIGSDLKAYIGKDISFFRKVGDRQIPIDSNRIMDAYKLMNEKQPAAAIENVLFN